MAALIIVVIGFVVYSSDGIGLTSLEEDTQKLRHRMLPFQPRGSVAYLQRSNSDPNMFWSPEFTPKSTNSRFGRYSPATKMMSRSPKMNRSGSGINMRSELTKSPLLGNGNEMRYNALSSTPPINITIPRTEINDDGSGDSGDLEMELTPSLEAASL